MVFERFLAARRRPRPPLVGYVVSVLLHAMIFAVTARGWQHGSSPERQRLAFTNPMDLAVRVADPVVRPRAAP